MLAQHACILKPIPVGAYVLKWPVPLDCSYIAKLEICSLFVIADTSSLFMKGLDTFIIIIDVTEIFHTCCRLSLMGEGWEPAS